MNIDEINKLLADIETREMRDDEPPHKIIGGAKWVRRDDVVEALLHTGKTPSPK